jgi:1-acyl-sn-glycerol-3-phosphate acyltransferase
MEAESKPVAEQETYSVEIWGWYRVARDIVRFLLRILARVEVEGLEFVPEDGPYLLLTNHLHWLDPPVILTAAPHKCYVFAAAKRERHWFFGPLFRSMGTIWVHRGTVDRKALRQAIALLRGGGVLGMAPEGTRSKSGAMQEGRSGAAYLAYRTGVPVVPVAVAGQEKVFPSLRRLRRARVRISFGPPFRPPPAASGQKPSASEIRAFTEEIMYRLAALLPPEYRGLYSDVTDVRPDLVADYGVHSVPERSPRNQVSAQPGS